MLIRGTKTDVQKAELEIKRLIVDMPVFLSGNYYVPDYACGRIIGRGGQSIKEMQKMSNCKIRLMDRVPSSSSGGMGSKKKKEVSRELLSKLGIMSDQQNSCLKVVNLIGGSEQINLAKELILEMIKEEEQRMQKKLSRTGSKKAIYQNSNCNSRSNFSTPSASTNNTQEINNNSLKKPESVNLESYLDGKEEASCEVFVSAIANPLVFWIQIAENSSNLLRNLEQEMTRFYEKNESKLKFNSLKDLKIDQLVAVISSNHKWHRGEIKYIDYETKEIDIYFVDFGDSVFLKLNDLRALNEKNFYDLEFQAIECSMDNLVLNNSAKNEWSEKAICFFEDVVHSCKLKPIKLKFVKNIEEKFGSNEIKTIVKPSVQLFDLETVTFILFISYFKKGFKRTKQSGKYIKSSLDDTFSDAYQFNCLFQTSKNSPFCDSITVDWSDRVRKLIKPIKSSTKNSCNLFTLSLSRTNQFVI
jgi:tudor domain-containing protein 2